MAVTRKMLEELGLEEDAVSKILSAHIDTVNGLKNEIKQLEDATSENETLKTSVKDWKDKYEKEHSDLEGLKQDVKNKETLQAKEAAYKELLKKAGVSEKRFKNILRCTEFKNIELDDEGKIKDSDSIEKKIKEEWEDFIVKKETDGASVSKPAGTNGGSAIKSKEDIYKKDDHGRYLMDATERQQALAQLMASESE